MKIFEQESAKTLYKALLSLKTEDECRAFLEDVCTIKEVADMSQRLEAAMLLSEGHNYQQIGERLGISTATISRVSRCLNYGAGGYVTVIERLGKGEGADE